MIPLFINIVILAVLSAVLFLRNRNEGIYRYYWPLLLLKVTAGIAVGLMYTYYYPPGDTFAFFEAGQKLAQLATTDPGAYLRYWLTSDPGIISLQYTWQPNVFFAKTVSLFNLLTANNYWLVSAYFSFISFTGLWMLARVLVSVFQGNRLIILLALFCVPSVTFWSSGLLKESLMLACISGIVAGFLYVFCGEKKWSFGRVLTVGILFLLLWKLRYYYAGLLFMSLCTMWATHYLSRRYNIQSFWRQLSMLCGLGLVLFLATSTFHPNFYPSRILQVMVDNHDALVDRSDSDRVIQFHHLRPDLISVIKNTPLALISGLFRPFLWEARSITLALAGLENLFLIVLIILSLIRNRATTDGKRRILAMGVVIYCLALAVFLALSAPNFGTLMRYKVGFLPFLYMVIMLNNPFFKSLLNIRGATGSGS